MVARCYPVHCTRAVRRALVECRAMTAKRIIAVALAPAALSLLTPSTLTHDAWWWLIWGRDVLHLSLDTRGGSSWKPFPVLLTTPFALAGKSVAPALWLVVARAGCLLAMVLVFRL